MPTPNAFKLEQLDPYRWRIPQDAQPGMRVPGIIYADARMIETIRRDNTPQQVANAACLPGTVRAAMAMPDIHWGYGLPIGGVVACRVSDGVVSPGGVGSDINCGVRLLRSDLTLDEVKPCLQALIDQLYRDIPVGVGSESKRKLTKSELVEVITQGSAWVVRQGWGWNTDTERTEANGCLPGADFDALGTRAQEKGYDQLGTLGAGNHFLEIQVVTDIHNEKAAEAFGLRIGQICVMIHSGSRGLGYQVCEAYMASMGEVMRKYGISLPDRQLGCAPVTSPEGKRYLGAMAAAANYAWANRQMMMHLVRQSFAAVLGRPAERMGMHLVYDVAHNIAKFETHELDGKPVDLIIHRKGATRAFGPDSADVPQAYRAVGQPVIIPGNMGSESWVMVGTAKGMAQTWGSTCHGAGRSMSRTQALKATKGRRIDRELADRGIIVRAKGRETLGEEAPEAYKDVSQVVGVVDGAGISRKVARLVPLGCIKG